MIQIRILRTDSFRYFQHYKMTEDTYNTTQTVWNVCLCGIYIILQYGSDYLDSPYILWKVVK